MISLSQTLQFKIAYLYIGLELSSLLRKRCMSLKEGSQYCPFSYTFVLFTSSLTYPPMPCTQNNNSVILSRLLLSLSSIKSIPPFSKSSSSLSSLSLPCLLRLMAGDFEDEGDSSSEPSGGRTFVSCDGRFCD